MNTSVLIPGYTSQVSCILRSGIYEAAEWLQKQDEALDGFAKVSAKLLSKASEYVELPIRVTEDVALTSINLVGSFFSSKCKKNLDCCVVALMKDLKDAALTLPILFIPGLVGIVITYHVANAILNPSASLKTEREYQLIDAYEVDAKRQHGAALIQKFNALIPMNLRKAAPAFVCHLFNLIAHTKSTIQLECKLVTLKEAMDKKNLSQKIEVLADCVNNWKTTPEKEKEVYEF